MRGNTIFLLHMIFCDMEQHISVMNACHTVEALITHTPKIHDYAAIAPITHTLDHPWKGYGLRLFAHQVGGWKVL